MRWIPALAVAVLGFLLPAGVAACGGGDRTGGSDEEQPSGQQPAAETESVHHIHGLGVDPTNGTLYVATHTGLFKAAEGEQRMRRIGDSAQDIMGFSVVSPDRFIGSGHPDPNDTSSPPNLGLIESRDGGMTWKNISLLGEADFHVLESSGSRIYGFDGTQGRLMVSSDGGRSWQQRSTPAAMFALGIHPRDHNRVVASTERGLFRSSDAGRRWHPFELGGGGLAGLLAWPRTAQLYLVDGQGQVYLSGDGGADWEAVGSIGGQPAAFIAAGGELYAALSDATVKRSTEGGRSWTVRATP